MSATVPSKTFTLAPGPHIEATLKITSGSLSYPDPTDPSTTKTGTSVTIGSTSATSGSGVAVTISQSDGYVDGHVSIKYGSNGGSASCKIDFSLNNATLPWHIPNDANNANILTEIPGHPLTIPVSKPTGTVPSGVQSTCQPLNTQVVFMVDKNTNGNVMFRGNCPLAPAKVNWGPQSIDFQVVHDILATRYKEATGNDFYSIGDYVWCDVNLQSPGDEKSFLNYEIQSMGGTNESQLADQAWYPQTGHWTDPVTGMNCRMVNYSINPDVTVDSTIDNFDASCSKMLHEKMNHLETGELPHVYYIHCASGHDRTGIIASTYLARQYTSMSLNEAFIRGTTVHKLLGGTGQLQPNCRVITDPTHKKISTIHSRILLIGPKYNATVVNIYNYNIKGIKSSSDSGWKTLTGDTLKENPAYVYDDYPWST